MQAHPHLFNHLHDNQHLGRLHFPSVLHHTSCPLPHLYAYVSFKLSQRCGGAKDPADSAQYRQNGCGTLEHVADLNESILPPSHLSSAPSGVDDCDGWERQAQGGSG